MAFNDSLTLQIPCRKFKQNKQKKNNNCCVYEYLKTKKKYNEIHKTK